MPGCIACIGAGTVGRAWAIVFARAGYQVNLFDAAEGAAAQARQLAQCTARDLEEAGLIASASELVARIQLSATLQDAVMEAVHVQESVREDAAIKRQVFQDISAAAPAEATLASSTSAIPGSEFLESVPARARCLVAHPVNPPSLIPLVELCASPWTAQDTVHRVQTLMRDVGQRPIIVKKEIAGFILNRLQYTLVGEALHLVGEGYCDVEDIDAVLTHGLALRWALMGPFQVAHLNATEGFQGFVDQLQEMMRTVGREARPDYPWDDSLVSHIHASLARQTPIEAISDRQGDRDRNLMRLRDWLANRPDNN